MISIYLDSDKMSHYGIGSNTIAASLFAKGFVTTAGTQKGNGYDSPIQGLLNTSDFKDCVLKAVNLGYDTDTT